MDRSTHARPNDSAIKDWLRLHSAALDQERELERVVDAFAAGAVSRGEMEEWLQRIAGTRVVLDAVMQRVLDSQPNRKATAASESQSRGQRSKRTSGPTGAAGS